jgi:hypothetical protein
MYPNRLVHWCHGATGFLPLLLEVEGLCSSAEAARVRAAAEAASQVIWERGLLLKVTSTNLHRFAVLGSCFLLQTQKQ